MEIKRGNTAIARKAHSKPYKLLLTKELITKDMEVLDFGCGRGYDVLQLQKEGFDIQGYDPFQDKFNNPIALCKMFKYDLVTCNYVFNVIESPAERIALLKELKGLGNKIIISLRADKKAIKDTWKTYEDGYITPKGTFQKFYTPVEVESFFNNDKDWDLKILSANSNEICIMLESIDYLIEEYVNNMERQTNKESR